MFERRIVQFCLSAILLAGLATGCTFSRKSAADPKARLQEYISKTFVVKSADDRKELLDYLGGDAHRRLSAWSDEQFQQAFVDAKRQFVKLVFTEVKPVNSDSVDITYELTYLDQNKGQDARVTNKKLAEMVREHGKWLIDDVRNIKQLIEYKNEMSLP